MSAASVYSPRETKGVCPSVDFGFTTPAQPRCSDDATVAGRNSSFSFDAKCKDLPSNKALSLKSFGTDDENVFSSASTICSSPRSEPSSPQAASFAFGAAVRDVVIKPRRRAGKGEDDKECVPITITLEVLESLYSKPLNTAAKTIGISITAFKKVCRSLGVRNWPYRFQDLYVRPTPQVATPKPAETQVLETPKTEEKQDAEEEITVEEGTDFRALLEHSKQVWGNVASSKGRDELGGTSEGWLVCPLNGSEASEVLACGWDFDLGGLP
eukprot:423551-Rhodomonas_salina.1